MTEDYILELASGSSATNYSMSVDIPQRIRFTTPLPARFPPASASFSSWARAKARPWM